MRLASVGVLAGAYRGRDIGARTLLTHAVVMAPDGGFDRVLCPQPIDRLADETYPERPTCPKCAARVDKLLATGRGVLVDVPIG